MGLVYHVFNTVNGKCYVGQTWHDVRHRWNRHIYRAKNAKRPTKFHAAIRCYGEDKFIVSVLTDGLTQQNDLDECEVYWIEYFNSFFCGYNISAGGNQARHSHETIEKISKALTGKPKSAFTRNKISQSHLGKSLSLEHKMKIRKARLGKTHDNRTREKIAKAKKKAVCCIEDDKIFSSIGEAADFYHLPYSTVQSYLQRGQTIKKYGKTFKMIFCKNGESAGGR